MDPSEAAKLKEAVEAAHRRTDNIDRRVAVLESQFADLRADVRALVKQTDTDAQRLARIETSMVHMSDTLDRLSKRLDQLSSRVWTQLAGGGIGGAGLTYVLLQVLGQS